MSLALEAPTVTPETVRRMGERLGIALDDVQSLHLLSVARLLLTLPLPTNFKHAVDEEKKSVYIDKRTSLTSETHPRLVQAKKLVAELQRQKGQGTTTQSSPPAATAQPGAAAGGDGTPADPDAPPPAPGDPTDAADASTQRDQPTDAGSPTPAAAAAPARDAPASTGAAQTAMGFSRPDAGASYYYDFATSTELPGQPEDGQVIEDPPQELLRQFGLVSGDTGDLTTLRFYSWWYEDYESNDLTLRVSGNSEAGGGLKRRYVTVEYDIATQTFTIRSVTDDQEIAIANILAVTSKSGSTVEVWDLHVGATLNIMGRMVALMKADGPTAAWNELHARRLKKLKVQLQDELQKYRFHGHKTALTFDRGDTKHGGLSLRYTVNQINTLLDELHTYRPSKAAQMRGLVQVPP